MSDRSLDSSFNSREAATLILSINFVYCRCKEFKSKGLSEGPVNSFSAITQWKIILNNCYAVLMSVLGIPTTGEVYVLVGAPTSTRVITKNIVFRESTFSAKLMFHGTDCVVL